jgi:hypothetical protein
MRPEGRGKGLSLMSYKDVKGHNPVACITIISMFSYGTRGDYVAIIWYSKTPIENCGVKQLTIVLLAGSIQIFHHAVQAL